MNDKLLLSPDDFKPSLKSWGIDGIFNPAAMRLPNKKIILYVRVAESSPQHKKMLKCPVIVGTNKIKHNRISKGDVRIEFPNGLILKDGTCRLRNLSHFRRVILDKNGFDVEKVEQMPFFTGIPGEGEYGVEDPRIIKIEDRYLMTYVAVSLNDGVSTCLALSKDLKTWKRQGIIFREQNKDVVIFPEKIKGKYVALHRPEGNLEFSKPSIWISYSPDLTYWGKEKSIIQPRKDSWDEKRVGSGCPPIKTKKGWLVIYHGVKNINDAGVYSAGSFLLDKKNPEKVLARTPRNKPFVEPFHYYERKGFLGNVVFPTGAVESLNGKDLIIYSGGADSIISAKQIPIKDFLEHMEYY